ncbi:MAG: hypothetical protein II198_05405, partial [Bacteroidaceae bacterium]|nr:hypothetical protein [Bacteroidaceae bacterium]
MKPNTFLGVCSCEQAPFQLKYESLEITAEETENAAAYEITVTGDSVETLLAAVSLGEALPVEGIQKLTLCLTEEQGKLEQ